MQRTNSGFILVAALALAFAASPALARDGGGRGGGAGGGVGGGGGAAASAAAAGGGAMAAPSNAGMARSGGGARFSGRAMGGGRTFSGRTFGGARFAGRGFRNDGFHHRGFRNRRAFFAVGGEPYFYDDYAYDPSYDVDEPSYEVTPQSDDDAGYCQQRYRSYDPASGTYLGFDGMRHPCP
jgi:hypothetical protein